MRTILNINQKWSFTKQTTEIPSAIDSSWDLVNLPHSWNAVDGQDGGNDYHRGTCHYAKLIEKKDLPAADRYYLEIKGANSSADVYVDGKHLTHHDGGYSTWRVDLTDSLGDSSLLVIAVDNSANETVYPQMADFTFYGGLYRDVNIIAVSESHFDLDYYGAPGIKVTPTVDGKNANVDVEVFVTNNKPGQTIRYTIYDADENALQTVEVSDTKANFTIENVHLWNGRKDPYLYCCEAELVCDGEVIDNVCTRFGCRSFEIDPNKGFILNGEEYPLRGVSRHQDRWGVGNALLPEHHEEDIEFILEMGATTIRLAHYQHDQYFYDLCHEMDPTRLTTIAAVSMCKMDDPYLLIPDVVSYNHYFGWYGGETDMNGPWFDKFHQMHPNIPIGCSEYGCEALNWHTSQPMQGDYTEEYQSYYHEELIKQFFSRKFMWATHVWNMFDFGADARCEGGENGQNHKGLVTMDRKYKKDSFYAYKAWLSDDPFVHICSKRYVDRVEEVTRVTVYSNQPEVELFAGDVSLGKQTAPDHFFYFDVPNNGETQLTAVAGDLKDTATIRKVETFNEEYRLKEQGAIINWFDINAPEGRLSLNDKMSDVLATMRGKLLFMKLVGKMMGGGKKGKKPEAMGFEIGPEMMAMMGGFTVLRLFTLMGGMMDVKFTKEELLKLNAKLNRIKKPKNKKK